MDSFSIFHWLILAGLVYVVWRAVQGVTRGSGPNLVCTSCGHVGQGLNKIRGSFLIEIVLWLCFLVPGLIYSLWRLSTRGKVCSSCGATSLVPTSSPVGSRIILQDRAKDAAVR